MIFHIADRIQWEKANSIGVYKIPSLRQEEFVHCSTEEQALQSANNYYHGQSGLLLLCIASNLVKAPIIYEDSLKKGETFPHIYGALNLNAVLSVFEFPPNPDGSFSFPDGFHDQLRVLNSRHL